MLQHGLEQLPMMPQLGGEVSSLLRAAPPSQPDRTSHDLPHTVPMEPLLHGLDDHGDYQVTIYLKYLSILYILFHLKASASRVVPFQFGPVLKGCFYC